MKKRRTLLLAYVMGFAMLFMPCMVQNAAQCHAQKNISYQDNLAYMLSKGGSIGNLKQNMNAALVQHGLEYYTNKSKNMTEAAVKAKVEEYSDTQLYKDIASAMIPYVQDSLSKSELIQLRQEYETPEGKTAIAHTIDYGNKALPTLQKMCFTVCTTIMQGKTPADVALDKSITPEYAKKFNEYSAAVNSDQMVQSMIDGVSKMVDTSDPKMQKFMKSYCDYLQKNVNTLIMNTGKDCYTMSDLDFYIKVSKMPCFKHYMQGMTSMLGDLPNFSTSLFKSYDSWLDSHK